MPSAVTGGVSAAMASKQRRAQLSKKPEAPTALKNLGQPHRDHDLRKRVLKARYLQKTNMKELIQSASQPLPHGEAEIRANKSIGRHVLSILHQGIRSSMAEQAGKNDKQNAEKNNEQKENVKKHDEYKKENIKNDKQGTEQSASAHVKTKEPLRADPPNSQWNPPVCSVSAAIPAAFEHGVPCPDTQDRNVMREWLTSRVTGNLPAVHDAARRMMDIIRVSNLQPEFPLPGGPLAAEVQPIRGRLHRWARIGNFERTLVRSMEIWDHRPQLTSTNINFPAREPGKLQAAIPAVPQMQLTLRTSDEQFARLLKVELPDEFDPGKMVKWTFFDMQMPLIACKEQPPVELRPIPNSRLLFGFPERSLKTSKNSRVFLPQGAPIVEFNDKEKMRYRTNKYRVFREGIQSSAYLQSENKVAVYPTEHGKDDLERRREWWDSFHEGQQRNKSRWEHIFRHMPLGNIKIILHY